MGEEVHMSDFCSPNLDDIEEDVEEERVMEWEVGLPNPDDVTPLCQSLIPPQLASAFSISPEPNRTLIDVHRASQNTLTNLRTGSHQSQNQAFSSNNLPDPIVDDDDIEEDQADQADLNDSRKLRKVDCTEEADSALRNGTTENNNSADDPSGGGARTLKRPRLVWTPQLHRRFVDVVTRIGIRSAVPKTIMQMMNVEGLTRENVASHLQKYRLYLKRMQGLSSEGPSSFDHLFASIPVPNDQSGGTNTSAHSHSHHHHHGNGHVPMPIPMMYPPQPMMPMPVMGMHHGHGHGHGHMGMGMVNNGFESHPYNMMQQRDWSGNNNPHVTTNDK